MTLKRDRAPGRGRAAAFGLARLDAANDIRTDGDGKTGQLSLLDQQPAHKLNRRARADLKRALKQRRAELHQWADSALHLDVLREIHRCSANPFACMMIDGSGPPSDYRAQVARAVGIFDPISNGELLRRACKCGLASPEIAGELKRRLRECRALHRRLAETAP